MKTSIRILQLGDEAALTDYLQPYIESSLFLLGNMRTAGLIDQGEVYQGTYAAAPGVVSLGDAGSVSGFFQHVGNRKSAWF